MVDKVQSPLIDTSLAPVKGAISNSDYVFVRGADESIEKVLVSDLLAGTAGAIRIRGEADMDNASTTSTSVVIIGDPNNATMEQGVAPVDTSPNGVAYVVKTAQSGVQTQISGTVQTVFDGDQIIWSGSKWSILALGNAVTSVDNQTGAVNLEDKYYWTGNKPNIEDIPNLQGTLDSKYSPENKPTPEEIGAKANSYVPDWEEITNKPGTSTRWPSFAEVTNKPSSATRWPTFSEVTNKPSTATRWPAFSEVTGKPTYYPTQWEQVSGKPTTFPTSWGAVTGKPETFPTIWDSVTDKPDTFPTTWSQVSGTPIVFPTDWDSVSGKPTTFPPSSHNHDTLYYTKAQSDGRYPQKSEFGSGTAWSGIAGKYPNKIDSAGVLEIGKYLDFHDTNSNEAFSGRLYLINKDIGFNYSTRIQINGGLPTNDFSSGQVELIGNANKGVYPNIGFHQPGSYGGSIQMRAAYGFTFVKLGAVNLADIYAGGIYAQGSVNGTWKAYMQASGTPNEYVFGGEGTNGGAYIRIGINKLLYTVSPSATYSIYHEGNKPTKADVGLSNVPNYTISNATNDPSTNKFASTAAVYSVSQRVAALEGSSTGGDVYDGTDPKNTEFPIGTYLVGGGPNLLPNDQVILYTDSSEFDGFHYSTQQGSSSKLLNGVWACRGKLGGSSEGALFQRIE